jgi:hypothetical protein
MNENEIVDSPGNFPGHRIKEDIFIHYSFSLSEMENNLTFIGTSGFTDDSWIKPRVPSYFPYLSLFSVITN